MEYHESIGKFDSRKLKNMIKERGERGKILLLLKEW